MIKRNNGNFATEIFGKTAEQFEIVGFAWSEEEAIAADNDGLIANGACKTTAVELVPDEGAKMPCARNVTATSAGTAGDIKAVKVTVYGKDIAGNEISEELPTFTADSATTVTGNKAFAEVTKIAVPGMDGNGAKVKLGWGSKLGLPMRFDANLVLAALHNGARESTAPTVAADKDNVSGNTVTLNTTLNGKAVEVYCIA